MPSPSSPALLFTALDDLIALLEQQGIPVITFHGDAPLSTRSAFVGPDSHSAGALSAEVLSKLMGGRGHVLSTLYRAPGAVSLFAQRHRGFQTGLECQPYMHETIFPNPVQGTTPELVAALAQADGVYVGCDELVLEWPRALDKAALSLPFVGFSNTERTCGEFLDRPNYLGNNRREPVSAGILRGAEGL